MTANCSILWADVDSCSSLMHISSTIIHDKIILYSLTDVVVDSYSWTPNLKASPTLAKLSVLCCFAFILINYCYS